LTCTNGVVTNEQNCGSMGGYCSELMGPGATCVSTQCTPSANVAPVPGTSLCVAGVRHVCGADGWPQPAPCDAGLACVGAGQCEGTPRDPQCPPSGKATHCDSSTTYVSCSDGLKTGSGDCAIFEGICLEPITGEAACAEARCAEPMSLAFTEHMICVEGVRHRCDVTGWSTPMPCADGASCTGAGECASQCVPYAERCNGADDDCDGIIDESQPVILGGPCPSNTPGCEVLGQWACGPTEVPVCVTAPGLCPPETHADAQAGRPLADTVGGAFEPAGGETAEAEPTPVTSTCSGGPSPCVPLTLCVLAWRAGGSRGRRPFSRAAARDAILG